MQDMSSPLRLFAAAGFCIGFPAFEETSHDPSAADHRGHEERDACEGQRAPDDDPHADRRAQAEGSRRARRARPTQTCSRSSTSWSSSVATRWRRSRRPRPDLVEKEQAEIAILSAYLPKALTDAEIADEIASTIAALGVSGPQGMGKVMAELKPRFAGRADMTRVSGLVKAALTA